MREKTDGTGSALPSPGEVVRALEERARFHEKRVRKRLNDPKTRKGTIVSLSAALFVLVSFLAWTIFLLLIPDAGHLSEKTVPEATIAYTADGLELTRYHIENRTW